MVAARRFSLSAVDMDESYRLDCTPFRRLFGVLLAAWVVLYLPLLIGHRVLPWDAMDEFYPTVFFNAHSLHHGVAPWWNPSIYAGYPQIADPQGMLFSPLMMAWMLLPSSPGATWFAWAVLLHMLLGATAMLALLRQWGGSAFGSLMGALVFMGGGVAASRMEHVPIVLAYAYAPVALWTIAYFLAAPTWRRGALLGVAVGALLTQLVQLTYLLIPLLAAYGVFATTNHWSGYDRTTRWRWLRGVALGAVVAAALGLPQLLFTLAFTTLSNRAALPVDASADGSLRVADALTFLYPNALKALAGTPAGTAPRIEAYFYIGALPLLLLFGLPRAWRQPGQRRQLAFFGVAGGVAFLYSLGLHSPIYPWLFDNVPGMHFFRRPSDAAYLLNLALAVAVGLSATHIDLQDRRTPIRLLVIALILLFAASLGLRDANGHWHAASIGAVIVAALACCDLARKHHGARRVVAWMLIVLVVDYRSYNLNGSFTEQRDSARSFLRDPIASYQRAQPGTSKVLPQRIEPIGAWVYWDNLVVLRGLQSTQGYNPLRYALYDHWYGARDNGNLPRINTPYNTGPDSAMANLLGVDYVVRDASASYQPWTPPLGYERVHGDRTWEVWHNTRAYPRLLTPVNMRETAGDPDPAAFTATDFRKDFWLTPRDEDDRQQARRDAIQCRHALQAEATDATPTHITVHSSASEGPGWLVVSQLDFPGWQARANGVPLAIHRANGMFSAICVPAGEQTVTLSFHPLAMVDAALRARERSSRK
ncbi:YfhO family protein [Dyella sp. C11]|uniref:YfhO family protein n=1 Tax=Dyella sp. C11 TaxID=2126991 RepID=UPI000D65BCAA|nr:YfhO family protein [Dyella sp. C11]